MSAQAYFALRALRGGRWPRALGYAVPATAAAVVAGGGLAVAIPVAAAVTTAVGLASVTAPGRPAVPKQRGNAGAPAARRRAPRRPDGRTDGLGGIAHEWARAHPWRFAAGPAVVLAAALLATDLVSGWSTVGAALAGLAVLVAPRLRTVPRTAPVRTATALATRRLALAVPASGVPLPMPAIDDEAAYGVEAERHLALTPVPAAVVEAVPARGNFREMPGVSPIAPRRPRPAR